jgi:hypothetical protein
MQRARSAPIARDGMSAAEVVERDIWFFRRGIEVESEREGERGRRFRAGVAWERAATGGRDDLKGEIEKLYEKIKKVEKERDEERVYWYKRVVDLEKERDEKERERVYWWERFEREKEAKVDAILAREEAKKVEKEAKVEAVLAREEVVDGKRRLDRLAEEVRGLEAVNGKLERELRGLRQVNGMLEDKVGMLEDKVGMLGKDKDVLEEHVRVSDARGDKAVELAKMCMGWAQEMAGAVNEMMGIRLDRSAEEDKGSKADEAMGSGGAGDGGGDETLG